MKALLALGILAAMTLCGQLPKTEQETTPQNTAPAAAKATPDKEALKAELVRIEERITQAAVDGDITELVRNTTDDFKLTDIDGKVQNKNEALADVKKEKNIKNFSITEPELQSFTDDSAVLAYTLNVTGVNGRSVRARSTDSYVKKDGKWLLKSQQQTLMKK